jgi:SAM-dependent methyltransferase
VVAAVAELPPGRALDLGCGTGTNVLYLAQHGWFATGVDASSTAIESARRKADWIAGATFVEGDVTRLSHLGVDGPFDLVLDIGCYDGLPADRRDAYAQEVGRVARPGARFLVFASGPGLRWPVRRRTGEPENRRRLATCSSCGGWSRLMRRPGQPGSA